MDDSASRSDAPAVDLDPRTGNPRELMRVLLPAARRSYIRAWELLADSTTPLDRRRAARERAAAVAEDHGLVAAALREREPSLSGDDLLNARHVITELDRHAAALGRLATISPHGLVTSADLRPEALGCGKRYRDPARATDDSTNAKRGPAGKRTGGGQRPQRGSGGPSAGGGDRRPRRPRGDGDTPAAGGAGRRARTGSGSSDAGHVASGPTKHESVLGDDLDEATRAKLEALRKGLDG